MTPSEAVENIRERFIHEVRPYFQNAIMQGENGDELREDDLAGEYARDLFNDYVFQFISQAKEEGKKEERERILKELKKEHENRIPDEIAQHCSCLPGAIYSIENPEEQP